MANKKNEETKVKPEVKKETKKVQLLDNKMYSFEANGSGRYQFVKGKIYSVSGRTANELIRKGLGKVK